MVYRLDQCLQSMVKIKYNNMKISKKPLPTPVEPRRRTLRSAFKNSSQDIAVPGTSSDEKAIQQIHKQFDNQQSINASKSTGPIHQDLKPQVIDLSPYCMRTRRTKYVDLPKPKQQDVVQEQVTKLTLEEVMPVIVTPIIEQVQKQQKPTKQSPEQLLTPVKQQSRNLKADQNPVLKVSRRSGRKHRKNAITQVPFRKFQDSFEQKIVVLINRIYQRKINQKDFELFMQKLHRITSKQLYSPYVISGIQTIANLLEKTKQSNGPYLPRLSEQVKRLSSKIWQELGKTDDYEDIQVEQRQVNFEEIKPKFIKKIYKMLLQTNKYGFKQAREMSFHVSQSFFSQYNSYNNEDELLSFFRDQKFLRC